MTTLELNELFGKNLRYYREKKGFTQADLAKEVGILPNTLSNFEHGLHLPSCRNMALLGFVLEVDVWRLFYYE
jgi:transcriptional regulator with XRE-family HTH domain